MKTWFNNLKVSQKLLLISIFFVMPDSLMLYLFITGINESIQFSQMEAKGNEYQRPLEELLKLIPQHRLLAESVASGQEEDRTTLSGIEHQIDSVFDSLAEVDLRIGTALQFTDAGLAKRKREHYRVQTVREEWQTLKAGLTKVSTETSAEQHLHLIADVRMMITHAGDLSNLILDPDLDSYYLMDATLLALPQTQERLATIISDGKAVLEKPAISIQDRQLLTIHATLLKEVDLDRIRVSLQTAVIEDPNFYGVSPSLQTRVPRALKEYHTAADAFIAMTIHVASSEQTPVTVAEYLRVGSDARAASFKLWKVANEEMDRLLDTRIASYQRRRATSLLVAALALLAAVGFVTFISRSISGPLHRQAQELQMANAGLQAEIVERQRAEAELATANAGLQAQIAERQRAEVELEKAHQELLETSRFAGMAEIATNVLHNVGNVLNSVNVSASLVSESVKKSKATGLSRVVSLMKEHEQDLGPFITTDARGKLLPAYLAQLSECIAAEQKANVDELSSLEKNIDHIKEIVAMQQSYAKVSGVKEIVHIVDLVEDSLRMNAGALNRHGVDVIREFEEVPPLNLDKHKILQILVNLIRNAKYACDDSGRADKQMILKISTRENFIQISVTDNGVGIPPENMTRIFSHGFTTRKLGHGFGLHSGALAAREMGGSLSVQSEGAGKGAAFTLELPMTVTERIHE